MIVFSWRIISSWTKRKRLYGSAKLGSHGSKDITKVMDITNGSGKGDHSNP
jgi:hypothetical protein